MSRFRLFNHSSKTVRDSLNTSIDLAQEILRKEEELIEMLSTIDHYRYFVRYGYKSLRGFCIDELKFSETQSQRLVNIVRKLKYGTYKDPANSKRRKMKEFASWDLED